MAFKLRNPSPFSKVSDSDFFTDSMREGFGAGKYGSYSNPSLKPETYSNSVIIDSDFGLDTNTAKAMTTSRDVPDMTNKIEYPKVKSRTPGASRDLESKIKTAESRGNLKRAARLEGRQDRRIERQTEGAKRIEARQAEKTAKVKKRQEDKTKKSIDTSTDGKNLQMKNDSPNKFLGGIAASAISRNAQASGTFDRSKFEALAQRGGAMGRLGQMVLDKNPIADPTTVAGAAGQAVAGQAPLTAGPEGTPVMDPGNPFEGKTFQITPANMMGNAKPTFSAPVQASAEAIYGSPMQRQMSMPKSGSVTRMTEKQEKAFGPESEVYQSGNTAIYDGLKAKNSSPNEMSPLNSYENPQTVIDRSHGYVASKAAEAFGKIGEELIKKKKGENEDENEQ
jgi:hypothetical protein